MTRLSIQEPRDVLLPASRFALIVGIAGFVVMLVGLIFSREAFFRSYLYAYLTILGIALGSMSLIMLHHLTGGAWGLLIRRINEAAALTLPLLAILFIPLIAGFRWLYPWARPEEVQHDLTLQHRHHQFNLLAIVIRAAIYFSFWIYRAWRLQSTSLQQDKSTDPRLWARARRISAIGFLILFVTVTLAAFDWIASRETQWYSSTFGLLVLVGYAAAGMSFALVVLAILAPRTSLGDVALPDALHDLGNLLLTIVILWAYISFAQLLVIWMGNSGEDNIFYVHRSVGFWHLLDVVLIVLHFSVPFVLLLQQGAKRNLKVLGCIGAGILFLRFIDTLWLVGPSSSTAQPGSAYWLDFVAPFAIGGIWLSVFLQILARHRLVPVVWEALPKHATEAQA